MVCHKGCYELQRVTSSRAGVFKLAFRLLVVLRCCCNLFTTLYLWYVHLTSLQVFLSFAIPSLSSVHCLLCGTATTYHERSYARIVPAALQAVEPITSLPLILLHAGHFGFALHPAILRLVSPHCNIHH